MKTQATSIPQNAKPGAVPVTSGRLPLFGTLRSLIAAALLVALSILFGKYLAISTPFLRFSFENLPILAAGIFFGPFIGGAVGALADLIGCVLVGYAINPVIMLGGVSVGVVSGLITYFARRKALRGSGRFDGRFHPVLLYTAVMAAHVVGSMIIKSIGMAIYFGTPVESLLWRIPLYIATGALEGTILLLLNRNRLFMGEMNRLITPRRNRR